MLLLVSLALMQVACGQSSRRLGTHSTSDHHSRGNFTQETETKVDTLEVKPDMTTIKLDVYAELSSGSIKFLLADPNGEVIWEEEITGPDRYKETHKFDPVVGDWTLDLTLEDATGGYDIQWSATN
jgi:hypothetical protein